MHRTTGTLSGVREALSLVEMLIVVVIIGIAAGIAVPMLGDTNDTRLQAAARLLMADLEFARIQSITHGDDPCLVVFDQGNNSYSIANASDPSTPIINLIGNEPYTTQFGTGRAAAMTGVTIQGYSLDGDDRLGFGIYGELDQTTSATITLQAGTSTLTITVDPVSGETSL